jgi:hypothetical protein
MSSHFGSRQAGLQLVALPPRAKRAGAATCHAVRAAAAAAAALFWHLRLRKHEALPRAELRATGCRPIADGGWRAFLLHSTILQLLCLMVPGTLDGTWHLES